MNYRMLPRLLCPLFIAGILSACAVAPSHYYSLSAANALVDEAMPASRTSPYAIDVQPVAVPGQVDRPQIVVYERGKRSQLIPLSSSLWASPLSSQIRNTLSNALTGRLGAPAIVSNVIPEDLPVWRVHLQVHRFESAYEDYALMDASWQLSPINQGKDSKTILCRASAKYSVESGISALVHGHDQALQAFADVIASQIEGKANPGSAGLTGLSCT